MSNRNWLDQERYDNYAVSYPVVQVRSRDVGNLLLAKAVADYTKA